MPVSMTYDSLVTSLENYLQRYDQLVKAQIPQFILLAQIRIPREMKLLGFRKEVVGAFQADTQLTGMMQKPADWRKTIAFYVGTGPTNMINTSLYERDYDFIREVYPDPAVQDTPRYYGDADYNHWLVQPSPPNAMPFKIAYYSTLSMLDETTQTNWLTINAPDLLLYASLLEAAPFLKTDERIQVWQGYYQNAKVALQAQEMEGRFDTTAVVGEPQPPSLMPR